MTTTVGVCLFFILSAVVVVAAVAWRTMRDARGALRESRQIIDRLAQNIEPLREEGRQISASIARLSAAAARHEEARAGLAELKTAGGRLSEVAHLVKAVISVKRAVSGDVPGAVGSALFNAFISQRRT